MARLLNDKQERFAQSLAKGVPLVQAYIEAGYDGSQEFVRENASKLKGKRQVRARIDELCASTADMVELYRVMLSELYVHTIKIDRASMYDRDGSLKPLDDLTAEQRALIESITETKGRNGDTHNAVMPSKLVAAAQLARLHGLDKATKTELTGADGAPLVPMINLSGRPEF